MANIIFFGSKLDHSETFNVIFDIGPYVCGGGGQNIPKIF